MSVTFGEYQCTGPMTARSVELRAKAETRKEVADRLMQSVRELRKLSAKELYEGALGKKQQFSDDDLNVALSTTNLGSGDAQRLVAEMQWEAEGKPYFKVYPDYCKMFEKTKLDIPKDFVKLPYETMVINLPTGMYYHPSTEHAGKAEILSVMVSFIDVAGDLLNIVAKNVAARAGIEQKQVKVPDGFRVLMLSITAREPDGLCCHYQFSLPWTLPPEVIEYMKLHNHDPETMEGMLDGFFRFQKHMGRVRLQEETDPEDLEMAVARMELKSVQALYEDGGLLDVQKLLIRLVLSVAFLATGQDKLVEPDVINKHMADYLKACEKDDEKTIAALGEKSDKVRGLKGRAIGKREHLFGIRYKIRDSDDSKDDAEEGEGNKRGELTYRHVRSPHFRAMKVGPGRTEKIVKFIKQIIVRPDLPINPADADGRGYRTPTKLPKLES